MKEFEIGKNGNKVLVVKQKNQFFSIGAKCSHYGAPLVKGTLGDGTVRCPWHGACFNLKTGKIITNFKCYMNMKMFKTFFFPCR